MYKRDSIQKKHLAHELKRALAGGSNYRTTVTNILGNSTEANIVIVKYAAQNNVDLSSTVSTIDSQTLIENDIVLLSEQTTSSQNGIYILGSDSYLTRYGDLTAGMLIIVYSGNSSTYTADSLWVLINDSFTVGTDSLQFRMLSSGSAFYSTLAGIPIFPALKDSTITKKLGIDTSGHVTALHDGIIIKNANEEVTMSATLQDDDTLTFTAAANSVYYCNMTLIMSHTDPSDQDFKCLFTVPSGTTIRAPRYPITNTIDANLETLAIYSLIASTKMELSFEFIVRTGSTSGAVTFQWAQYAAGAWILKVEKNSLLRYQKIYG